MLSAEEQYPISHITKDVVFLKHFITNYNITVGDYTYYADKKNVEKFETENVFMLFTCKLIIGKFCQIAEGTKFIMNDANHPMEGFSTFPFSIFCKEWNSYPMKLPKKGDTVVGNDVWFGTESVLMPGVKVGDGAIIGAYAVVTKDVAPYTIVGGNPARVIRKRFSDDTIKTLLDIRWWDWPPEKIFQNVPAIAEADIERLREIHLQ